MAATYLQPVSNRRRGVAIGLTLLVHILIVWVLLNLAPREVRFSTDDGLQAFDVSAARPAAQGRQARPKQERKRTEQKQRVTPPLPVPPIQYKDPPNVIWMSKEQFAKTDISKTKAAKDAEAQKADAGAQASAGSGGDSRPLSGPSAGPGGQKLYAAEWYREPTRAELITYLPAVPAGSWGIIACRTAPNYLVENCQIMGESPLGSGIATGMRRAAWQFRVIPPRINGKPQIGVWVQIKIDFRPGGPEVRR